MSIFYYIDSISGSDLNTGLSESFPWRSFTNINAKAAGTINGGDEIRLKRGSLWLSDYINFSALVSSIFGQVGGNAQNTSLTIPIKVLPYGPVTDPAPIIDLDRNQLIGMATGGGAFWIDGIEIRNSSGPATVGIFNDMTANASTPPSIWLYNNIIHHHTGGDGIACGFASTNTDSTRPRIVAGNHVYKVGNDGISLFGDASGYVVENNLVHNCAVGVPAIDQTSGDGLTAHAGSGGHIWRNNVIYDCIDGINNVNESSAPNIIEGNHVFRCREHCMWFTIDQLTQTTWTIRNNVLGMMPGMGPTGDWIVTCSGILVGFPDGDFSVNYTNQNFVANIYNNTIYNATTATPAIHLITKGANGNSSVWNVKNNIMKNVVNGKYIRAERNGKTPTWDEDYNEFHGDISQGWYLDGTSYSTLTSWRAASGKDAISEVSDPLLYGDVSTGAYNARLQRSSPCRDTGVNLSSLFTKDFNGRQRPATGAWDKGAMRY